MTKNSSYTSPESNLGLYLGLCFILLIIGFLPFLDAEVQKNLLTEGGLFVYFLPHSYWCQMAVAKNTFKLVSICPNYSFCTP